MERHGVMKWLTALVALSCVGCSSPQAPSGTATYRIGGTARTVSVTFTTAPGTGGPQPAAVNVPWTFSHTSVKQNDFVQVRAQITDTRGGSIEVFIEKNGQVCQTQTVSGFGAVATVGCVF